MRVNLVYELWLSNHCTVKGRPHKHTGSGVIKIEQVHWAHWWYCHAGRFCGRLIVTVSQLTQLQGCLPFFENGQKPNKLGSKL